MVLMKKRIVTLLMALALVVAMGVPALAANEVTADEQALYDYFVTVLDSYMPLPTASEFTVENYGNSKGDKVSEVPTYDVYAQYKKAAYDALLKADVKADGANALMEAIKKADEMIAALEGGDRSKVTRHEAWGIKDDVLAVVNAAAEKSGMKVSLEGDPKTGYATIVVTTPGGTSKTPMGPAVKSTGFNTTATYGVVAVLALVLLGGVAMVRKNHLLA
jgi:hypothetical protein